VAGQDALGRKRLRALGRHIRAIRIERGLSQEELAHEAGLHRAVVGFIERAEREPGITRLWALADALDVSLSELFAAVDVPRPAPTRRRNVKRRPRI